MKSILVIVLILTVLLQNACSKIRDTSVTRKKRFALVWPSPGINWSQMVIGIGLPVALEDMSVTFGLAFKSLYWLPYNASQYTSPNDVFLASDTRTMQTRWTLYTLFATFAERLGYGDGKSCILRAICDVANAPFHDSSGIMGELLHVLLTPSTTEEKVRDIFDHDYHAAERHGKGRANCASIYPNCKNKFMDVFTRVILPDMIFNKYS